MGYLEIPDWMYERILNKEISFWVGMGFPFEKARHEAIMRMSRSFVAYSSAINQEHQQDRDEYEQEMSLGSQTYRVPR